MPIPKQQTLIALLIDVFLPLKNQSHIQPVKIYWRLKNTQIWLTEDIFGLNLKTRSFQDMLNVKGFDLLKKSKKIFCGDFSQKIPIFQQNRILSLFIIYTEQIMHISKNSYF